MRPGDVPKRSDRREQHQEDRETDPDDAEGPIPLRVRRDGSTRGEDQRERSERFGDDPPEEGRTIATHPNGLIVADDAPAGTRAERSKSGWRSRDRAALVTSRLQERMARQRTWSTLYATAPSTRYPVPTQTMSFSHAYSLAPVSKSGLVRK